MFGSDPNIFHSRLLPTGEVEFIYFGGRRVVRAAEEVKAADKAKLAEDQREYEEFRKDFYKNELGMTPQELRDDISASISIGYMATELGFDDEADETQVVDDASELDEHHEAVSDKLEADFDLQVIAAMLDRLQDDGGDSTAAELANAYITLHGMGYPLFELYQVAGESVREGEVDGEWFLGYRMSAAQAVIVPNERYGTPNWKSDLHELRRVLYLVTNRDELWDEWGIHSETTRWLFHAHVNSGKIIRSGPQREAWNRAIDPAYKNDGDISSPVAGLVTPLLVCTHWHDQEACTVASWMTRPYRTGGRFDTAADRWKLLLKLIEANYNWVGFEDVPKNAGGEYPPEPFLLVCIDGQSFDKQLVDWWLANPELAMPPKRWNGSAEQAWKYPGDQDPMRVWWCDPHEHDEDDE